MLGVPHKPKPGFSWENRWVWASQESQIRPQFCQLMFCEAVWWHFQSSGKMPGQCLGFVPFQPGVPPHVLPEGWCHHRIPSLAWEEAGRSQPPSSSRGHTPGSGSHCLGSASSPMPPEGATSHSARSPSWICAANHRLELPESSTRELKTVRLGESWIWLELHCSGHFLPKSQRKASLVCASLAHGGAENALSDGVPDWHFLAPSSFPLAPMQEWESRSGEHQRRGCTALGCD